MVPAAASLAVDNDLTLQDALVAIQSIVSDSVMALAAPHLALPFEVMQSRIPQFRFELLV
jgi:hypothetical protein